ncbi:MAG: hypothetical protein WCJ62_09585 [Flavobacterium sp.]
MKVTTTKWKYRLGSEKRVPAQKIPQKFVKTIYKETMDEWRRNRDIKIASAKRLPTKKARDKALAIIKRMFNKKIIAHRKKGKYVDQGDYLSRKMGINLDFYYRIQYNMRLYGHLYGQLSRRLPLDNKILFFPKHALRLIDFLIQRGLLKLV